jgi:hypothetical protein
MYLWGQLSLGDESGNVEENGTNALAHKYNFYRDCGGCDAGHLQEEPIPDELSSVS